MTPAELRPDIERIRAASEDLKEMASISTPNPRIDANLDQIDSALQSLDNKLVAALQPVASQPVATSATEQAEGGSSSKSRKSISAESAQLPQEAKVGS